MATRRSTGELGKKHHLVVVGTSLGGLYAVEQLLRGLPTDFSLPVAIVQHRGKDPDEGYIDYLQQFTSLPVKEVNDKDDIIPSQVYLAPPNYHLLVEKGNFALSTEGAVSYARPSIDVLFESAASVYGSGVIGVIMTGANRDGAQGVFEIKRRGGIVLVQEPESAESSVMPLAAIDATLVDNVLPLEQIPIKLIELVKSEKK